MTLINKTKNLTRNYQAPDCDFCAALTGAMFCDSLAGAGTEDWVYDTNEF